MARFSYAIGRLCRDSGSHLPFDPPLEQLVPKGKCRRDFPDCGGRQWPLLSGRGGQNLAMKIPEWPIFHSLGNEACCWRAQRTQSGRVSRSMMSLSSKRTSLVRSPRRIRARARFP